MRFLENLKAKRAAKKAQQRYQEQPTTYQQQRGVTIKTLMELRDNPPKAFSDFGAKTKTDFEKKTFFTKNKKIIQDILGNDVKTLMEFESIYGEIKNIWLLLNNLLLLGF